LAARELNAGRLEFLLHALKRLAPDDELLAGLRHELGADDHRRVVHLQHARRFRRVEQIRPHDRIGLHLGADLLEIFSAVARAAPTSTDSPRRNASSTRKNIPDTMS
jgi:hypothetical protein